MMTRLTATTTMVLFCLLLSGHAQAVEALSTAELAEHCNKFDDDREGKDAVFCVRYVQGFIDGAVATDERVTRNVVAEYEYEESFSERAIRTRSPSRSLDRMGRFGATVYADFCLGEPIALLEVVEHVVADLMNRDVVEEQLLARDAVYSVLRRDYPCEADADG